MKCNDSYFNSFITFEERFLRISIANDDYKFTIRFLDTNVTQYVMDCAEISADCS